jgi:SAM-dependent methyltransferase
VSISSSRGNGGKTSDTTVEEQGQQWSRHAARYDEVFLDPFRPGVENPCLDHLLAVPEPETKSVIDLGCGTGPLLPHLVGRFGSVTALDFAPGMIRKARARLGKDRAAAVTFLTRSMADLDDLAGRFDVVIAINSIVMPDERSIDRTMSGVRAALRPGGVFLGVMPAMDAIHYHTLLLRDRALDRGDTSEEADRHAAFHAEHVYYDFAFGRFEFQSLRQKFWQPFELEHRLRKAGFGSFALEKVLYPWDEHITGGPEFADQPRSWDWSFVARA